MKNSKHIHLATIFAILFYALAFAQQNDSTTTAFREGRWLTGLSGSISSTTTQVDNIGDKNTSNNFGINIETGKFIKNRFLIGGRFQTNKISNSGSIDTTTETFYVGPFSNYYFLDNRTGSLFATASFGYVRYKNEVQYGQLNELISQQNSEGSGIGTILGVGYSYSINDFIAFDFGLNVNLFWVNIEQESLPTGTITNTSITSNDISFSFGFNVILDDFFF